jgi:hypothetical protein
MYATSSDGKRACFTNDRISLPCGRRVDDIELAATAKGIEGRIGVRVMLGGRKTGQKPPKRRRVWIDHEVEVLAAPGHTMKRAREGPDDHVADAGSGQLRRQASQKVGGTLVAHGSISERPGQALLTRSSP